MSPSPTETVVSKETEFAMWLQISEEAARWQCVGASLDDPTFVDPGVAAQKLWREMLGWPDAVVFDRRRHDRDRFIVDIGDRHVAGR